MRRNLLATSGAVALLWAGPALAQQTEQQPQPAQQQQAQQQPQQQQQQGQQTMVAEQCLADLQTFAEETARTGYGMAGPEGYGVRAPVGGWYGTLGPRREMNAVMVAAQVFARHGREEACQTVLEEARAIQQERTEQLEASGIAPEEVRTWRHDRLLAATPVEQLERAVSLDNVIGADVRNLRDEDLGDIDDVVLGDDGTIQYVLLSHGGFLGVGEDLIPVRWEDLHAVPELDTFVLDVPEQTVENAPTLDRDVFANLQQYDQRREQVESYWQEQTAG